jgi:hypothetical protein
MSYPGSMVTLFSFISSPNDGKKILELDTNVGYKKFC